MTHNYMRKESQITLIVVAQALKLLPFMTFCDSFEDITKISLKSIENFNCLMRIHPKSIDYVG